MLTTYEKHTYPNADAARDAAIDWSNYGQDDADMGEILEAQDLFTRLAEEYPELKEEFKENAII